MNCDSCGIEIGTEGQSHCISELVPPDKRAELDAKDDRVYCGNCCGDVRRRWAAVVDEFNPHEE